MQNILNKPSEKKKKKQTAPSQQVTCFGVELSCFLKSTFAFLKSTDVEWYLLTLKLSP